MAPAEKKDGLRRAEALDLEQIWHFQRCVELNWAEASFWEDGSISTPVSQRFICSIDGN